MNYNSLLVQFFFNSSEGKIDFNNLSIGGQLGVSKDRLRGYMFLLPKSLILYKDLSKFNATLGIAIFLKLDFGIL